MDKVDNYIQQKLTQKITEYIKDALVRGLTKKEIKSYLLYKGHDKDMVEKMLSQVKQKKHNFLSFKKKKQEFTLEDKKPFSISHRTIIALSMIFIFILLMSLTIILKQPKDGNGNCPFVSDSNIRKVAILHFEQSNELSYAEMDELVATYLGRSSCSLINKDTIRKLEKIKLD